jgi:large subunit ribosomal protein L6
MSRLGKRPIVLPKDVTARVDGSVLTVKGPKGELKRTLPVGLNVALASGTLSLQIGDGGTSALQGCLHKLILNMVLGVTQGFKEGLQIEGVGYRAQAVGNKITFQLGFSKPYEYTIPSGVKVAIDPKQTLIDIEGNDKELVGRVAAQIRAIKKPEPYKGTGIRYKGEIIKKKAGKAAAGAAGATAGGGGKK